MHIPTDEGLGSLKMLDARATRNSDATFSSCDGDPRYSVSERAKTRAPVAISQFVQSRLEHFRRLGTQAFHGKRRSLQLRTSPHSRKISRP